MKKGVKPTFRQKKIICEHKLEPRNWLVIKEEEGILVVVNKASGKPRKLRK